MMAAHQTFDQNVTIRSLAIFKVGYLYFFNEVFQFQLILLFKEIYRKVFVMTKYFLELELNSSKVAHVLIN